MAHLEHVEHHFTSGKVVRDVVIGMSDGLTVPFALAAGLAGAVGDKLRLIVVAGLAEIAAGSIAMGLGGYLAARGEAEHYHKERAREQREVREIPAEEAPEVAPEAVPDNTRKTLGEQVSSEKPRRVGSTNRINVLSEFLASCGHFPTSM